MLRAAARRSAALAPAARRVHAQWRAPNSGAPVRQSMDPKWVPLFMRLSRGSTPGAAAAELTEWVRANRPVSQDQIVAYVRTICSFNNSRALEIRTHIWRMSNLQEIFRKVGMLKHPLTKMQWKRRHYLLSTSGKWSC